MKEGGHLTTFFLSVIILNLIVSKFFSLIIFWHFRYLYSFFVLIPAPSDFIIPSLFHIFQLYSFTTFYYLLEFLIYKMVLSPGDKNFDFSRDRCLHDSE